VTSVLVTGGAGYVGSHACKALARSGFRPVVLDNLATGHREFVRWGPLIEADIGNSEAAEQLCREHNVRAAMHFAASALVGESVGDPAKYYRNNVVGTLSLLEVLRRCGVEAFVFSSSCAVYGQPDTVPINEDTVHRPVSPYGASKSMVERILNDFGIAHGLQSVALRYFNACGADPDGEIGELRDVETHLIPRAMMWLQGHLDEFRVFGDNFPTPDGTAVRDYIHVCDLADAHVTALKQLLGGSRGGAFNLGTGRGHSVKQVLDRIGQISDRKLPALVGPRREGDPAELIADASRARSALNFSPEYSDLDTIIRTAWAWHRKAHPEKARAQV
jgi:UDP-glucose 4-epimerase